MCCALSRRSAVRVVKLAGGNRCSTEDRKPGRGAQLFSCHFQSRKDVACSGRFAAGQTRETGARCTRHPLCDIEEGNLRSKSAPRSTLRNLSNKLKIGQQFFTRPATAEIIGESGCASVPKLWKSKWIRLF